MLFVVRFKQIEQRLDVKFNSGKKGFDAVFENIQRVTAAPDYYEGEYYITPAVEAQIIPTAQKTMRDDLTVKAIPTYNVGNLAGGSTFYIATMDE